MKTNNYRGIFQSIKYILLAILFLTLMFFFAHAGWGTNTGGDSCDYYLWKGTEKNIGKITSDVYFQAISEGWLCRWTSEYYFVFYFWAILLYSIFKHFGSEILGKPVPLSINLIEFIIAWGIYLFGLLLAVSKQGFVINFIIFYNALIGTLLLICPILALIFAMYLYNKLPNQKSDFAKKGIVYKNKEIGYF